MRILDLVQRWAQRDSTGVCVQIFSKRKQQAALTWGDALDRAAKVAAFLKARGIARGDVVALMGGHELDLYPVWLGAVWLGAVPCVLPEPSVRVDRSLYWSRLEIMLQFAGVRLLARGLNAGEVGDAWSNRIPHFSYAEMVAYQGDVPEQHSATPDCPLLLQHSAGTTGQPKSMLLTHGMVERQFSSLFARTDYEPTDVVASWLPLYHDLGLIASFLAPLRRGLRVIWLSPFEWVSDPVLLLEAIAQYRVTDAYLPNFAFAFLANVADPAESFDLSSMRKIYSGGEPVTYAAVQAFLDRFESAGLSKDVFHVGYGMAESVAVVANTGPECPPKFVTIETEEWSRRHRAVPADPQKVACVTQVSCGLPLPGCEVRIVDDQGRSLEALHAGRVLIKTPYLFSGYHGRPDLNTNLFDAQGFYDSGDLGYRDREGHLFITGRKKDLVIVGGRNVYAQDVEEAAGSVCGVHPGRVVCFGITLEKLGTEGVVVLFESDNPETAWAELTEQVRRTVTQQLDVAVYDTRCVPRTTLRKSTAGKLARSGNRSWYLEGRFGELPASVLRP